MADHQLEENQFYKYIKSNFKSFIERMISPTSLICVAEQSLFENLRFSPQLVASQIISCDETRCQYTSELLGKRLLFEIAGDDPRVIVWNEERQNEVIVSKSTVLKEYLINLQEHVIHVALIDCILPSMIEDDQFFLNNNLHIVITSNKKAEEFLLSFRCHYPIISKLSVEIENAKKDVIHSDDVNEIQCFIHNFMLSTWDALIKRHMEEVQTNPQFQDLLFRALDFYIVSNCHDELWSHIVRRCNVVDCSVRSQLNYLRDVDVSVDCFGMSAEYWTPLPAAVVEFASMDSHCSAIERLHCVLDTVELIVAQIKEERATLCHYKNADAAKDEFHVSAHNLLALLCLVLVQSQCLTLVANIYYITHYVFSINDEVHPLWQSLGLLRQSLEMIMKVNPGSVNTLSPKRMRKELSLQDLMQMSADVESRFERKRAEGSHSISNITALDLHMHEVTKNIHRSTQALSETHLTERNSPSRRSDRHSNATPSHSQGASQPQSRRTSFIDFISSIPSTIRASFRRRQSEQKVAIGSYVNVNS